MPKVGQKVKVLKPACLKKGYWFRTCKEYRSPSGTLYDYVLYSPRGKQVKLQVRGARKYLSYNFTLISGAAHSPHEVCILETCGIFALPAYIQDMHVYPDMDQSVS